MPETTFTHFITLVRAAPGPITGTNLDYINESTNEQSAAVNDVDSSGTASAGDTWFDGLDLGYSGFTTMVGGQKYAIFWNGGNGFYIPNNGELDLDDFSSPITVTEEDDVAVFNCFADGTDIATPSGSAHVQDLKVGDEIVTASGEVTTVKWLWEQTLMPAFGLPDRRRVVEISAGALGENMPNADLRVTADHGMLIDGIMCHAGALVNGSDIRMVPTTELAARFTVWHIETENHDAVLANGAAAETFIDNVSRRSFDNYAGYEARYGDAEEMEDMPYPRAMSARQVPAAIHAKLATRRVA